MAFVSSTNVPGITRCRRRNRRPARNDSRTSRSITPLGGAGAISTTDSSDAPRVAASIAYVVPTPTAAISRPPSTGPAIAPVLG
jgi:hypothetical protein